MSDQLTVLTQHHQAQQLLNTYATYVDTLDYPAMETIAHPDITLVRDSAGTSQGRDAFIDLYRNYAESDVRTSQHMITNVMVKEQADGSLAVNARFLALTTHPETGARYTWGQYNDEMADYQGKLVFTAKRIRVIRTALIPEDMLTPENAGSFDSVFKG